MSLERRKMRKSRRSKKLQNWIQSYYNVQNVQNRLRCSRDRASQSHILMFWHPPNLKIKIWSNIRYSNAGTLQEFKRTQHDDDGAAEQDTEPASKTGPSTPPDRVYNTSTNSSLFVRLRPWNHYLRDLYRWSYCDCNQNRKNLHCNHRISWMGFDKYWIAKKRHTFPT